MIRITPDQVRDRLSLENAPASVRDQQTQPRLETHVLLAGERDTIALGCVIGIGTGKSDRHHLASPDRLLPECRRMLLVGHLALPFAVRRRVDALSVKERVAPTNGAVAQHHDSLIAAGNAVKHLHGNLVESVPDH
jgi:hypothetical protein